MLPVAVATYPAKSKMMQPEAYGIQTSNRPRHLYLCKIIVDLNSKCVVLSCKDLYMYAVVVVVKKASIKGKNLMYTPRCFSL